MKLFAKKPCSFNGKKFFIGDEIPVDHVLDPNAQKMMGVIEVVDGDSEKPGPDEGGPLLPPSPTLDDHEDDEEEHKTSYSKNSLSRMKKEELLAIAAELGVEATEDTKNDTIVAMILEKQGE